MLKRKLLTVLAIALMGIMVFTACNGEEPDPENDEAAAENGNGDMEQTAEAPEEVDMDDFNEQDVFIRIDGEEILFEDFQEEFERSKNMVAEQYGVDLDSEEGAAMLPQVQQQAIQSLISQEVMVQEAKDQGIEVTDEEVEQNIEELTQQLGGEEGLAEAMEAEGLDEESLQDFLWENLMVERLMSENLDLENLEVTEEEKEAYYAQLEESWEEQGQESTPYEEVKDQIEQQLQQQMQQEKQVEFLEELIASRDIERKYEG